MPTFGILVVGKIPERSCWPLSCRSSSQILPMVRYCALSVQFSFWAEAWLPFLAPGSRNLRCHGCSWAQARYLYIRVKLNTVRQAAESSFSSRSTVESSQASGHSNARRWNRARAAKSWWKPVCRYPQTGEDPRLSETMTGILSTGQSGTHRPSVLHGRSRIGPRVRCMTDWWTPVAAGS